MKTLRLEQRSAVSKIAKAWSEGARSVCLVMPTGAGKTFVGAGIALAHERVLWVCHRRELVDQAAAELCELAGSGGGVGIEMRGRRETPGARIVVTTIQSLLDRDLPFDHDLLVLDEVHHFPSEVWQTIPNGYKDKKTLGLTATPERNDGKPLGDICQALVVGATYSELLASKVIVPWEIYSPVAQMGHDFAMDPVAAYLALGRASKAVGFFLRVEIADEYAKRFTDAGVDSRCVSYETPKSERDAAMAGMRGVADAPPIRMLTNVYCLGEGVNVPSVETILLARPFAFLGGYIQACGRAGRAAPGKRRALLIDVCGASRVHGDPFQDWEYSLEGRAIRGRAAEEDDSDGEGTERDYVAPQNKDVGLVLSKESSFIPSLDSVPVQFLPRAHAGRLTDMQRKAGKRGGGASEQAFARRVAGGLGE